MVGRSFSSVRCSYFAPQQFLYFLPLPQGHGSFRPGVGPVLRMGNCLSGGAASAGAADIGSGVGEACSTGAGALSPETGVSWISFCGRLRRNDSNAVMLALV